MFFFFMEMSKERHGNSELTPTLWWHPWVWHTATVNGTTSHARVISKSGLLGHFISDFSTYPSGKNLCEEWCRFKVWAEQQKYFKECNDYCRHACWFDLAPRRQSASMVDVNNRFSSVQLRHFHWTASAPASSVLFYLFFLSPFYLSTCIHELHKGGANFLFRPVKKLCVVGEFWGIFHFLKDFWGKKRKTESKDELDVDKHSWVPWNQEK